MEMRYRKAKTRGYSYAGEQITVGGETMWKAVQTYEDSAVCLANGQWVVAQYRCQRPPIPEVRYDSRDSASRAFYDHTRKPLWSEWKDVCLPK